MVKDRANDWCIDIYVANWHWHIHPLQQSFHNLRRRTRISTQCKTCDGIWLHNNNALPHRHHILFVCRPQVTHMIKHSYMYVPEAARLFYNRPPPPPWIRPGRYRWWKCSVGCWRRRSLCYRCCRSHGCLSALLFNRLCSIASECQQ